jgi:hypothetical protein
LGIADQIDGTGGDAIGAGSGRARGAILRKLGRTGGAEATAFLAALARQTHDGEVRREERWLAVAREQQAE